MRRRTNLARQKNMVSRKRGTFASFGSTDQSNAEYGSGDFKGGWYERKNEKENRQKEVEEVAP